MDTGNGGVGDLIQIERGMAELYRLAIEDIGEGPSLPALREYRKRHELFARELQGLQAAGPEEPPPTFVDAYVERLERGGLRTEVLLTLAEAEERAAASYDSARAAAPPDARDTLESVALAERGQHETLVGFAAQPGMPYSTSGGTF